MFTRSAQRSIALRAAGVWLCIHSAAGFTLECLPWAQTPFELAEHIFSMTCEACPYMTLLENDAVYREDTWSHTARMQSFGTVLKQNVQSNLDPADIALFFRRVRNFHSTSAVDEDTNLYLLSVANSYRRNELTKSEVAYLIVANLSSYNSHLTQDSQDTVKSLFGSDIIEFIKIFQQLRMSVTQQTFDFPLKAPSALEICGARGTLSLAANFTVGGDAACAQLSQERFESLKKHFSIRVRPGVETDFTGITAVLSSADIISAGNYSSPRLLGALPLARSLQASLQGSSSGGLLAPAVNSGTGAVAPAPNFTGLFDPSTMNPQPPADSTNAPLLNAILSTLDTALFPGAGDLYLLGVNTLLGSVQASNPVVGSTMQGLAEQIGFVPQKSVA